MHVSMRVSHNLYCHTCSVFNVSSDFFITSVSSACNLGAIAYFDSALSISDHISATFFSNSCCLNKRHLRRIHYTLDTLTSLVHSRIDYCNSLLLNLPSYQVIDLNIILLLFLSLKLLNFITSLLFFCFTLAEN